MSRTSLLALFVAVLLPPPGLTAQTKAPPVTSGDIVTQSDVIFGKGGDHDLHADIAYPKNASGPLPAVIHIHGGAWIGGSYHDESVARFAQAGYFAASIEYRLANVAKWPAQIQDCKCAVRWLRANAAKYNVDPNRIGAIGESAGGHLVACLATMAHASQYEGNGGWPGVSSAVQAIVVKYGPTDLTRAEMSAPGGVAVGLFGIPYAQNPALYKSASPVYFVDAHDPPVLMAHGDADAAVPLVQAQVFADALTKAGVPNRLLVIHNAGHGLSPLPGATDQRQAVRQTVLDFFAKHLAKQSH